MIWCLNKNLCSNTPFYYQESSQTINPVSNQANTVHACSQPFLVSSGKRQAIKLTHSDRFNTSMALKLIEMGLLDEEDESPPQNIDDFNLQLNIGKCLLMNMQSGQAIPLLKKYIILLERQVNYALLTNLKPFSYSNFDLESIFDFFRSIQK